MSLFKSAQIYVKKGLSVIATNNIKRAVTSWKQYQTKIPSETELMDMFTNPNTQGIAVICGSVSGNLEVIDIDVKYGIDYRNYADKIKEYSQELYDRLLIIKTKSGGYHIYYKCEFIEGNQKLASRYPTDDEKHDNPMVGHLVLIETRGEGGYVVAPPSDGYTILQGQDIPILSIEDRDALITLARSFNQVIEEVKQPTIGHNNDKITIWDDFNQRGDVVSLL